ncbi:MAG: TlpA disulfide reductase family protein [Candidatus Omnitrophota bacterium]
MNRAFRKLFLLAVAVILLFSSQNASAAAMKKVRLTGTQAPDFSLATTRDTRVSFSREKAKPAMLFFFTTWCPYCREKMPFVAQERQKAQGVEIIPIDVGESKAKVLSYAEKAGLPFAVLLDSDGRVSESYGVIGVPTIVLISGDGTIVWTGNDIPSNYQEILEKK